VLVHEREEKPPAVRQNHVLFIRTAGGGTFQGTWHRDPLPGERAANWPAGLCCGGCERGSPRDFKTASAEYVFETTAELDEVEFQKSQLKTRLGFYVGQLGRNGER
jgi:hypothetical protein